MLEWVGHLRPTHPPLEGLEDKPFTSVRSKSVRSVPASLRSSVFTLLCREDLTYEFKLLNWET